MSGKPRRARAPNKKHWDWPVALARFRFLRRVQPIGDDLPDVADRLDAVAEAMGRVADEAERFQPPARTDNGTARIRKREVARRVEARRAELVKVTDGLRRTLALLATQGDGHADIARSIEGFVSFADAVARDERAVAVASDQLQLVDLPLEEQFPGCDEPIDIVRLRRHAADARKQADEFRIAKSMLVEMRSVYVSAGERRPPNFAMRHLLLEAIRAGIGDRELARRMVADGEMPFESDEDDEDKRDPVAVWEKRFDAARRRLREQLEPLSVRPTKGTPAI